MEGIPDPASNVTDECDVCERCSCGFVVQEIRHVYAAEASWEQTCVGAMSGDRTECVVASDECHGCWYERGL